jgi:hypothetical protein
MSFHFSWRHNNIDEVVKRSSVRFQLSKYQHENRNDVNYTTTGDDLEGKNQLIRAKKQIIYKLKYFKIEYTI